MQIKSQALSSHLQKKIQSLYVVFGSCHYLLNEAVLHIKKAWRLRGETDEIICDINSPTDWQNLLEEANSYSLFYEQVLLDVRFEKKTIDALGKEQLGTYLKNINPQCLIILQAPSVPLKQLQFLSNNEQVMLVQASPLTGHGLQSWIIEQLKMRSIQTAREAPALIYQYTQGNMLAAAQLIEKLSLIASETRALTLEEIQDLLIDQCEYQLYELADACLTANAEKALHLLRQACNNRTEPTLILWLLTQEIRQLIQLSYLSQHNVPFQTACNQQKIWAQRAPMYQKTMSRIPRSKLYQLLQHSKQLDEQIKTSQSLQVWNGFEQLALGICGFH